MSVADDWDAEPLEEDGPKPVPAVAIAAAKAPVKEDWDDEDSGAPVAVATSSAKPAASQWDDEDAEDEPQPAAASSSSSGGASSSSSSAALRPKKQKNAKVKEKEERERREKLAQAEQALQARRAQLEAEQKRRMEDPEYAAKEKLRAKKDMEDAERNLAADLFGDAPAAPAPKVGAGASAGAGAGAAGAAAPATTNMGLADGAGSTVGDEIGGRRTGKKAAPSPLDDVALGQDKTAWAAFAQDVSRKVLEQKSAPNLLLFLKDVLAKCTTEMKLDDVQELLRQITVVKNDKSKALQNKKKPAKAAKTLKSIGGDVDDYGDADAHDDYDFVN